MSHYPLYMSQEPAAQLAFEASAGEAWLNAEQCEYEGPSAPQNIPRPALWSLPR